MTKEKQTKYQLGRARIIAQTNGGATDAYIDNVLSRKEIK